MLVGNAGEGSRQYDDRQADETHLCYVQRQTNHQEHSYGSLRPQLKDVSLGKLCSLLGIEVFENGADIGGQFHTITDDLEFLYRQRREQAHQQHGDGYRRHVEIEINEIPLHDVTDQQVLGLSHNRGNPPHGRAHTRMHHDVAQESTELFQVRATVFLHRTIITEVVALVLTETGHYPVIHTIEAGAHRQYYCNHSQGIKECREKRRHECEQE